MSASCNDFAVASSNTTTIASYRIEYREASSATWQTAGTQSASQAAAFQVTGLNPQTRYVFRVVAIDAVTAETANSAESSSIMTPALPIPGSVNVVPSYQNATATWNKVDWNPDNYKIEVKAAKT